MTKQFVGMAHTNDPKEIVKATQEALIQMMQSIIREWKAEGGPGLTWDQLDFFLEEFKKKKPTILEVGEEEAVQ